MKAPPSVSEEEEQPPTSPQWRWSHWMKPPPNVREEERYGLREKQTFRSNLGPASS
jgi:hypothetical protein